MALLTSELYRIKAELGHTVLTLGAVPYIGIAAIFEQVIAVYMSSGATTTSGTAITESVPAVASPFTLTLADGTGFAALARVVIDVDDRQEVVTAQSVSGTSLTALLSKAHTGTYPVTVEGGESIIREILGRIRDVKNEMADTFGEGSIRKVDELEFWQTRERTTFGNLGDQLMYWRSELSQVLCNGQGLNMWAQARAGAQRLAVY
jgi:hypothetical protein